jgi:glycosyltransferase involved in cell wall biosynthesis
MKLYYVANARMPSEKAHGIQIAKMCEAFIEAGVELVLVVPRRGGPQQSLQKFYGLRATVPLVRLPVVDLYTVGRIGYVLASFSFMLSYLMFLWSRKLRGDVFIVYTVDLDNFSSSALALVSGPLFSEMHGGKPDTLAQRFLFRHIRGIIPINALIEDDLRRTFPFCHALYLVEPNGVDFALFQTIPRSEARSQLGLAGHPVALYAGRLFAWKGLDILSEVAERTPEISYYIVGGTREGFMELVPGVPPKNMFFMGGRPHSEMPLWFSAADALIVLGTKRDRQSYRYTSPMKLFEYLASGRPVAASGTPAIRQIVSAAEVFFWEPDNAEDFAKKVCYAVGHPESLSEQARAKARTYSWTARAKRITNLMRQNSFHA